MPIPRDRKYSATHEYLLPAAGEVTVGITDHAAEQLGDVVYVELPEVGKKLEKGQSFGVVESVKAVSDLYAPVAGTVVAVNERLADEPGLVNLDPYGAGWILRISEVPAGDLEAALSAEQYEQSLG